MTNGGAGGGGGSGAGGADGANDGSEDDWLGMAILQHDLQDGRFSWARE